MRPSAEAGEASREDVIFEVGSEGREGIQAQ